MTAAAKQVPFALSLALNRTAGEIQKAQVQHMHDVFDIKATQFFGRPESAHRSAVKRTKAAKKNDPVVELAILPPGGIQRADIITRHESQHARFPVRGQHLAVPVTETRDTKWRRGQKSPIQQLNLKRADKGKGKAKVYKGDKRTFMIQYGSTAEIYQRTSRRGAKRRRPGQGRRHPWPKGVRLLWALRRKTKLTPVLEFHTNAGKVFHQRFGTIFKDAYEHALRTAR